MSYKILKYFILIISILLSYFNSLSFVLKINPLLIGTWKLRTTNDKNIDRFSYLILNDNNTFKFKSIKYNGVIMLTYNDYNNTNWLNCKGNNFWGFFSANSDIYYTSFIRRVDMTRFFPYVAAVGIRLHYLKLLTLFLLLSL